MKLLFYILFKLKNIGPSLDRLLYVFLFTSQQKHEIPSIIIHPVGFGRLLPNSGSPGKMLSVNGAQINDM